MMAEGVFADRNLGWDYVRSPNASQHDFTRALPGGGRKNVQVKFHIDGDPAKYASDMKKDHRANYFAVPDDHVKPLQTHLADEYKSFKAAGDSDAAERSGRNIGRVIGIGASGNEISSAVRSVGREATRERYATYTSFGAALVLYLGPTAWDWANGDLAANQAMYRASRSLSVLGVGITADTLLGKVRQGALRGSVRGNVIVGTAMGVTEITWVLHDHGLRAALGKAEFYEAVGGTVGALALGTAGFVWGTAIGSPLGPGAPVVGFVAGGIMSAVGYFGGRFAPSMILEIIPEGKHLLPDRELTQVRTVMERQSNSIGLTQKWPPTSTQASP